MTSCGRSLGGPAEVTGSHIQVYLGQADVINFAWVIDKSEATHFWSLVSHSSFLFFIYCTVKDKYNKQENKDR